MKKIIKNLKEMEKFAQDMANKISGNPVIGRATIVALYGDLGSGKTTFTKSFVSAFGVKQTVTSPTFVIEKIYKLPDQTFFLRKKSLMAGKPKNEKFKHIIHIDAYRLNSGEEMKDLGWDKISSDPKNIILIEWPEKIADILPKNIKRVDFSFVDENRREVSVTNI